MPNNLFGLSAAGWWTAKAQLVDALDGMIAVQNQVANPNAQVNTVNITATGPTIASSSDTFLPGTPNTNCLKITGSASSSDTVEWRNDTIKMWVVGDVPCAFSLHIKPNATTTSLFRLQILWYDGADVLISTTVGSTFTVLAGADWTRITYEATAPSNAAFALCQLREVASFLAGRIVYVAGVSFTVGGLFPYFDGNTPGCKWDAVGQEENDVSNVEIKRVFENPPNGVKSDEWPCFIIYPPAIEDLQRRPGGWRVKFYRVQVTCLVSDAEVSRANAWADAFREGFVDAIDNNLRMNETVDIAAGPTTEIPPDAIVYDNRAFIGFDGFVTFRVSDAITYGD